MVIMQVASHAHCKSIYIREGRSETTFIEEFIVSIEPVHMLHLPESGWSACLFELLSNFLKTHHSSPVTLLSPENEFLLL
jgi:hypothetical protein